MFKMGTKIDMVKVTPMKPYINNTQIFLNKLNEIGLKKPKFYYTNQGDSLMSFLFNNKRNICYFPQVFNVTSGNLNCIPNDYFKSKNVKMKYIHIKDIEVEQPILNNFQVYIPKCIFDFDIKVTVG